MTDTKPETDPRPDIFTALAAVMADVRGVAKREKNTAPGQNYNFRGIDAVVNAVGPAIRKHSVIVVPHKLISSEYGSIEVGKDRKIMGHARVTVGYRWYGPRGDFIETEAPGEAMDAGDKATAKAMSVAFRTMLLQALGLPTDERDPDADSYERSQVAARPAPATPRPNTALSKKPEANPARLEHINQMLAAASSMDDLRAAQKVINTEWATTIVPERNQMVRWVQLAEVRIKQDSAASAPQEDLALAGAA